MMASKTKLSGISRRSFLATSAGLIWSKLSWTESLFNEVLCWRLIDSGDTAKEQRSGTECPIASRTGHAPWVGASRDRALRLDGYSVWVTTSEDRIPLRASSFTLSAWIALEAYPVEEAAIVNLESQAGQELRLAVDSLGFLLVQRRDRGHFFQCRSSMAIERGRWLHLAAVVTESRLRLYVDGRLTADEKSDVIDLSSIHAVSVMLGRSPDCPIVAEVFPSGVVNGLLRDVCVFSSGLTSDDLKRLIETSAPDELPDLQINGTWCADDPQRPIYHALPPRAWTNEPHGLIHWGGEYHIFYQKNANGPYWGNINWGHMTSPDLYYWTEQPVALSPEPGPDSKGCWSGSVIDYDGKLAILYTGGNGTRASICLATSEDGIHFRKHPGNPVIAGPPSVVGIKEFRDPHVWREGDIFYLLIGSGIEDVGGTALLYKSPDLIHWTYCKPLLIGNHENSGVFWEMPVFFRIGSEYVLIVCEVPGRASYWIGSWKDEEFIPRDAFPRRLELFNHMLSPTPWVRDDGRVITMGIIPDQRSPKECWRAGWAHLYSLPRSLAIDASGHLRQIPFEGVRKLFEPVTSVSEIQLAAGAMKAVSQVEGNSLHLQMTFQRGGSSGVAVRLRCSPDEREFTEIRYQWEYGRLTLDRVHSSLDSSVVKDVEETVHFPDVPGKLNLEIFIDNSVLEVFVDQRSAFATRIYPTLQSSTGILFGAEGGAASIRSLAASRVEQSNGRR